jgi:hypothetical protein
MPDNSNYEPCNCSFCLPWAEKTGQVGYVLKKSSFWKKI